MKNSVPVFVQQKHPHEGKEYNQSKKYDCGKPNPPNNLQKIMQKFHLVKI